MNEVNVFAFYKTLTQAWTPVTGLIAMQLRLHVSAGSNPRWLKMGYSLQITCSLFACDPIYKTGSREVLTVYFSVVT